MNESFEHFSLSHFWIATIFHFLFQFQQKRSFPTWTTFSGPNSAQFFIHSFCVICVQVFGIQNYSQICDWILSSAYSISTHYIFFDPETPEKIKQTNNCRHWVCVCVCGCLSNSIVFFIKLPLEKFCSVILIMHSIEVFFFSCWMTQYENGSWINSHIFIYKNRDSLSYISST